MKVRYCGIFVFPWVLALGLVSGCGSENGDTPVTDQSGPAVFAAEDDTMAMNAGNPAPATPNDAMMMPAEMPAAQPNGMAPGPTPMVMPPTVSDAEMAGPDGVECGASPPGTQMDVVIGGRDVIIDYPCNKPVGTKAVFILNLHGTMPMENIKLYQRSYFAAHRHIDTHNLIIAAPRAIGSQWENGDGRGMDEPHLLEVVDYIYEEFSDFDIQAMWIGGHSWGAFYSRGLVCESALMERAKGVILMSGGAGAPACASRLSVIGTVAENDTVPGEVDQTSAAGHGCGDKVSDMVGNNRHDVWPDCDPGYVHANYFMFGKMHATGMDAEVVEKIVDEIVSTIQ